MGIVQKDAFRTMIISYFGIILGYLNKGFLFLLVLSTEQIGLVNLLVSVGLLFAQFANLGSIYTTWKFLPYFKNAERRNHGFLPLMLLLVSIGILLCFVAALAFRSEIEQLYQERSSLFVDYYLWMLPIGISYVLFMLMEVYLRSFYKNILSVIAFEILLRLGVTLALMALWLGWMNFDLFVIIHSLIYILPTVILLIYLFYTKHLLLIWPQITISKRFKSILLQFSIFNYFNTLGTVLVNSLDVMMIAQFIGLRATGVYSTVVFLASALQVPYKSIIRISSPLIADHWKHRELDKMKALYTKVSSVSLVIGLFSFSIIWLNIDYLFSFLKPEFQEGRWVFFFLMCGRLLDMYFGLNGSIFTTSKKYKYDIYFTAFLILGVFGLNLLFIPAWGMAGAAISTSIALICYNVGRVLFVYSTFSIHPFTSKQLLVTVVAYLAFISANFLPSSDVVWVLLRTIIFTVLFIVPIYKWRLEDEILNYIKNGMRFLTARIRKRY